MGLVAGLAQYRGFITQGSWWAERWTEVSDVPWQQRRSVPSWAVLQAGWGRFSFPFSQSWSTESDSGFPSTRETWTYWAEFSKRPQIWGRPWNMYFTRKGWELELFSLEKRRLRGILAMCINIWWEEWRQSQNVVEVHICHNRREGTQIERQ